MGESEEQIQTVTLGNGICLRLKSFPVALIRRAVSEIPKPEIPKLQHEDKGGAEEDFPEDPAYQEALSKYNVKTTEVAIDVMLVGGTEVESVPKGKSRPEENGWTDLLEHFHINFDHDSQLDTYLAWLRLYALAVPSDWATVVQAVSRMIGLSEKEVDQAVDSFPGREVGGADNSVPSEDSGDGDSVPEAVARSGARGRRKRGG